MTFVAEVSRPWPALFFELEYEEYLANYSGVAKAQAGELENHCTTF